MFLPKFYQIFAHFTVSNLADSPLVSPTFILYQNEHPSLSNDDELASLPHNPSNGDQPPLQVSSGLDLVGKACDTQLHSQGCAIGSTSHGLLEALPPTENYLVASHHVVESVIQGNFNHYFLSEGYVNCGVDFNDDFNIGQYDLYNRTIPEETAFLSFQLNSPGLIVDNAPHTSAFDVGPAHNTPSHSEYSNQSIPSMHVPVSDQQPGLMQNTNDSFLARQIPDTANVPLQPQQKARVACRMLGCVQTFRRDPDRNRHELAYHGINQTFNLHVCPVAGCPKSQGRGYTRKDKLTEHLWRKHGNLGYAKRV